MFFFFNVIIQIKEKIKIQKQIYKVDKILRELIFVDLKSFQLQLEIE